MADPESAPFEEAAGSPARRLAAGLAKIGTAIKSRAWRGAGPARLTPTQGQTLAVLAGRPPLRLDELAADLGVTAPTASDAVAALVDKGLVRRARSATDGRAVALSLTDAGRGLANEVAGWPDFLLGALDTLDEAEQATLLRSITKIIRGLQEAGDIPVQRMCINCTYFRPHAHDGARPHHCALVDAAFGDRALRLDCPDQSPASPALAAANWTRWRSASGPITKEETR